MAIWSRALEGLGVNPDFWRCKRVFLTGHTGFKGAWLSLWLQQLGAEVTGYALSPSTQPNLFEIANVGRGMRSIIGDIRDGARLQAALLEAVPDVVIHMAAQAIVRRSHADPVETYSTNVMGSVNLLEAVRRAPSVRAVVVVTSDKCYENREWLWGYREDEPMGGRDPYSSSKGCTELVAASYRSSYFPACDHDKHGVGLGTARAGNVIGGGDWSLNRLVPDALRAHTQGNVLLIRNPAAIRPWQFVLEPLGGYLTLAERLFEAGAGYAEAWNFGPREDGALSVEILIERLSTRLEGGIQYRVSSDPSLHESMLLKLDCSKAAARLDWRPKTSINETLQLIADWQNKLLSGCDMHFVTLAQIKAFQSTAQWT